MGVKFQGSFSSGTYFRTEVSNITSRVNCHPNSSKGRYTRRCVLIRIQEEILSTYSWGSIFAFGLLALTSQGRVLAVGCVIVSLLFIGSALGRVRKCRNSRHSRGNGFPKGEVNLVFVRGWGVKGIRLDKINSAALHNPSGLSREVKGYRCLSKGFGRRSQVKGHDCKVRVYLCLCLPQVPLVLSNLLSSKVVVVMSSISRSTHFWCSTQKVRLF